MFSSFCNKVVKKKKFLDTPLLIKLVSTDHNSSSSFTVSYLINSCGLSLDKATSASKKVHFENSTKPDSVLTLFRNHEFSKTHISKIIEKCPSLLLAKVDKTLKPKLDFFNSIDLSSPDLAKILSADPFIFRRSIRDFIIPTIDYFKTIVHTNNNVILLLKSSRLVLNYRPQKYLAPNIAVLRALGVPDSNISTGLITQPRMFFLAIDRFKEIVEQVKKMEFDSLKYQFVKAIHALGGTSDSFREAKLDVFKCWGWSEDHIYNAFKREPCCLKLSAKNIMHKMEFFVSEMGCDPLFIAKYPLLLMFSMEKRIIPRCAVIKILISNGLIEKDFNCSTAKMIIISDKDFLAKFVTKFEKTVPKLLNAYQGNQGV